MAIAHDYECVLRQMYAKGDHHLMPIMGWYGYAKQYRYMLRAGQQIKGFLGRMSGISNMGQYWFKYRNDVELIIGHLKAAGSMWGC